MARIITIGPYQIWVYPDDYRYRDQEIHCHVYFNGYQVKVWLPSMRIKYVGKATKYRKQADAQIRQIVDQNRNAIGKQWREYHGN